MRTECSPSPALSLQEALAALREREWKPVESEDGKGTAGFVINAGHYFLSVEPISDLDDNYSGWEWCFTYISDKDDLSLASGYYEGVDKEIARHFGAAALLIYWDLVDQKLTQLPTTTRYFH